MPEIPKKKRKFIKRNFKQLSIEELSRQTDLKSHVIRALIDEYRTKMAGKDQSAYIKSGALSFLSWKTILLTSFLFATVAIIIYSPSLHGDFVFDDQLIKKNLFIHITRLSQLTDLLFSKEIDRRIGYMSFALNYYFGRLNPFGYHLVNIIIHILNGLILFLLSHKILTLPLDEGEGKENALKIAFLGSLFWLVHPIQTQAVSYIVQRLTSLSSLFFLLSLLCYLQGRVDQTHKRVGLFILCLLFGLLSLGTKQNAATLPLFIILSEFFFFQHKFFKVDKKRWGFIIFVGGLFILISGIYLGSDYITRMSMGYEQRGWTPLERVLTQLRVVILYISLLIYPHPSRLNLDHDFAVSHSLFSPFTTFLSLLFIIGLLSLAIFIMRRNCLVSYGLLWFFGNLVIESSIIPLELVFEHRLYLPSMGLMIVILGLCVSLPKREWGKWVSGLIILLLLIFSCWTYERASVWQGQFYLWMDASKKSPYKARPHSKLGNAYFKKGMLDEAISEYKKALTINPNFIAVHSNLGYAFHNKGMLDEAISEYKKALTIMEELHNNLVNVYLKKDRLDETTSEHKKTITIKPDYAMAHVNLGVAYVDKGMLNEAISEFKKALTINHNLAKVHNNLAVVYYSKGNYKLSIVHCDKAVELGFSVNPKFLESLKPYR